MNKPPVGKAQFTAQDFIDAIPGTGGVISAIARRMGCAWRTAQKYIKEYPTVAQAYADECERMLDLAESVIYQNVRIASELQRDGKLQVDSSDAKWLLARKGRERGYGDRTEVTGDGGGPLVLKVVYENKRAGIDDPAA